MVQSCESWTEREAQVARWRSSGLKAEAYCEQQGLALPSFLYWVKRLRR
ncbi:IS66 family insertion sequence element accessory protein TnpA, partial [Parachitinimonas caeni]